MPDCDPIRTRNEGLKTMVDPLREIWPPYGVTITCGPVTLLPVRDDHFPELTALVRAGIHPAEQMPFLVPWTVGTPDEVSRRFIQYHWSVRGAMTMTDWKFETAIVVDGEIVGCQAFAATDFPESRTGETGSWIGRGFQGRGIGTLARQAICAFAFDSLGARSVASSAFTDNPASITVSTKVGYRADGTVEELAADGRMTVRRLFTLSREDFVAPPYPVEVTGARAFKTMLGID